MSTLPELVLNDQQFLDSVVVEVHILVLLVLFSLQPRERKGWLGGLDSNQDNQIQSLMSYRLNDLPAEGGNRNDW